MKLRTIEISVDRFRIENILQFAKDYLKLFPFIDYYKGMNFISHAQLCRATAVRHKDNVIWGEVLLHCVAVRIDKAKADYTVAIQTSSKSDFVYDAKGLRNTFKFKDFYPEAISTYSTHDSAGNFPSDRQLVLYDNNYDMLIPETFVPKKRSFATVLQKIESALR